MINLKRNQVISISSLQSFLKMVLKMQQCKFEIEYNWHLLSYLTYLLWHWEEGGLTITPQCWCWLLALFIELKAQIHSLIVLNPSECMFVNSLLFQVLQNDQHIYNYGTKHPYIGDYKKQGLYPFLTWDNHEIVITVKVL